MGKYKFINRKFPPDFQKVADYIYNKLGIVVSLGDTTEFLGYFDRQIIIHHNYDITKNGLFALLHECGHALQPPTNVGVNSYKNLDKNKYPTNYKLGRFIREVDAWNRGYEIARKLNIPIDMKEWEREKTKTLLTYY